ncbi:protein kinase domain-containing protein [Bacillus altitudinis]|uniref:protein kinase domain-containing protein n=1 Tax=Bacillus altitudinis TaxID=293387 RepID=UPI0039E0B8FE
MLERYEVIENVKPGGMGVTYKAFDKNLERNVLIKNIKDELLQGHQEKHLKGLFKDEALIQARLSHNNIAQVYDYFENDGVSHIVFELVDGKTLDELELFSNLENKEQKLNEILSALLQIAEGISYAHLNGIIHRDIKLNNIMYNESTETIKIIDFGIARVKEAIQRDHTAAFMLTKLYAAPERLGRYEVDTQEKFDIYSFGVVCFQVLTGELPYMLDWDTKPVPSVNSNREDINEDVNEALISMIQPNPKERIGDLNALIKALKRQINQSEIPSFKVESPNTTNKIRDPIHGYIGLTNEEREIVDHPIFQRLRRIKQLSTTYLVYPGATHDRFSHSLGVMHVATRIFDELINKNAEKLSWDPNTINKNRQVLRLVALLHDIGHAPFSHVGDSFFPPGISNHEKMAAHLIRNTQLANLIDSIGKKLGFSHKEIAGIIEGKLISKYRLINQIFASQLDADKMDYLLRDSMMLGVSYGNFDLDHLIRSLNVNMDEGIPVLVIEKMGIQVVEELILARYFMFVQVYFHKTRRIYDQILTNILREYLPSQMIPSEEGEFLKWDDFKVLELIKNVKTSYNDMYLGRKHLKLVYEKFPYASDEEKQKLNSLHKKLELLKYPADKLIIDEYQQSSIRFSDEEGRPLIGVREKNGEVHSIEEYSSILASMKEPIYLFRVYAAEEIIEEIELILQEELS